METIGNDQCRLEDFFDLLTAFRIDKSFKIHFLSSGVSKQLFAIFFAMSKTDISGFIVYSIEKTISVHRVPDLRKNDTSSISFKNWCENLFVITFYEKKYCRPLGFPLKIRHYYVTQHDIISCLAEAEEWQI